MKRVICSIVVLLTVITGTTSAGLIIFVDTDAGGTSNGSSWTNAYNHLQDALVVAASGDEIRVAEGAYRPDQGVGITPGDRTASFQLKRGVTIEGGYAGVGNPDPNTRDIELYETILSGDLDSNDVGDFNDTSRDENSYHVVIGSDTCATTVLDGFTISGGNANGTSNDRGGGMYNSSGSPKIINCIFSGNYGKWAGGLANFYYSRPLLINCTFSDNTSSYQGAGIYNKQSSPLMHNCTIIKNAAGNEGGAIFNRYDSHPAIINCTLSQNSAGAGGGIYNFKTDPIVINSIIWGNSDDGGADESAQIHDFSSQSVVNYSCIEGWTGSLGGIGNIGADPCFADADNQDRHLQSEAGRWDPNANEWVTDTNRSPCIDAGDPNSAWTGELWAHGRYINMGAFGGTPQASMSLSSAGNIADLNADGLVNNGDVRLFAGKWLCQQHLLCEDLNRNSLVDFVDFTVFAEQWGWQGHAYEQAYSTATAELRRLVNEEYSYWNLRGVNWENLFVTYSDVLNNVDDPNIFAQHAAGLLANAQDMHLWIEVGGQYPPVFKRSVELNYNLDVLPTLVPGWVNRNSRVSTGYFSADNIGYIWIDSWSSQNSEELEAVFEALEDFNDANGLIIDVRANGGGVEGLAQEVAGCFVTASKLYAKHRYRDITQPDGFGPVNNRWLNPNPGRPYYNTEVVVLMGQACMSSCDAYLLMMKQVPDCTLVGVKSYGSSGNTKPHEVGNGVTVYLPSWLAMRPDET
ncbi:MAG: S41 family peptidase, partial [Planctomycetota bacterium]